MRVATSFVDVPPDLGPSVVAIGTFDGVHRGHQYLLSQARQRAHTHHQPLAVVTFDPCPELVLQPTLLHYQLVERDEKISLMRTLKPDLLLMIPFTLEFARRSAADFVTDLEKYLHVTEMWMGEDFAFGYRRSGNVAYLIERGQQAGFSVHVIPRERWSGVPVSSTEIRACLLRGDVEGATDLLGHSFQISGLVQSSKISMTESILLEVSSGQALPCSGTYSGTVSLRQGHRRTEQLALIEVPIDAEITPHVLLRIRPINDPPNATIPTSLAGQRLSCTFERALSPGQTGSIS